MLGPKRHQRGHPRLGKEGSQGKRDATRAKLSFDFRVYGSLCALQKLKRISPAVPRSPSLSSAVVEELVPHKKKMQSSRKALQTLVDADEVGVYVNRKNAIHLFLDATKFPMKLDRWYGHRPCCRQVAKMKDAIAAALAAVQSFKEAKMPSVS